MVNFIIYILTQTQEIQKKKKEEEGDICRISESDVCEI